MKPRKPPNTKHDLFPDTWVIGTAAAALAKNDEGVLLAEDPDTVEQPAPEVEPAPVMRLHDVARTEPPRSIEEELAELRAENERLRRCIAGSRGDLDAMNWHGDDIAADHEPAYLTDSRLYLDGEPHRMHDSSGRPLRMVLIGGMLVIALSVFIAAWFAGQRLTTMEGPLAERVAMLRADIAVTVGGLGDRAIAWVRPPAEERPGASGVATTDANE